MSVSIIKFPKLISKMFKKVQKSGLDKQNSFIYVGECMEDKDTLHTKVDVLIAMNSVFEEATKALKDEPAALAILQKHFSK